MQLPNTAQLNGSSRQIWLRAGLPILGLVLAIIFCAIVIFWNLAQHQDRAFAENSQRLVTSAVEGRVRALSNTTADFAFWNDAVRAITVRWDAAWLERNFSSVVADGILIFSEDREVRYEWLADASGGDQGALAAHAVTHVGRRDELRQAAVGLNASRMVLNRFMVAGDRLVLISTAPVSWETEIERHRGRPRAPVDFIASVDVLNAAELAQMGEALGLEAFAFEVRPSVQAEHGAWVRLPTYDGAGNRLGDLVWRNPRPGSAGFLAQVGPITIGLLLIGALTVFVTSTLVGNQLESIARAEAALESNRMKSEFIATMSHELRTPLNAVIGYAELIQEQAASGDVREVELGQDTSRILRAARHLLQLINAILDHSRLDAGREVLSQEDVRVAELLAEVREVVEHLAAARGNVLRVSVDPDVQCIVADPLRLRQCLLNLVGNAIKFTANGTIAIHAKRERYRERDCVVVEVADTGIGIEKEALLRLFAPFVQADAGIGKQYGGSGLGLSITRKLARAMGGDVFVTSEAGRGSTFFLFAPATDLPSVSFAA